ncbi:uncharacterized protein LOC120279409 [Dioscorea cayenensis subsp. rotundata]|uniref:Uncharacterized protein LOC120279409 n=1 Tax=Dioscorea cayennensis subsp. rotundata TaxID=55577 RepID=A0AB40CW45_DIOCR|nr:uncharacterized protein LOC120279409 [Dioscorea cayenensis subsp. rotundata]
MSPIIPIGYAQQFSDKNGGVPNLVDINSAQNLLNDLNLCEPPLVGRKFTWTNGQIDPTWVRLDRFLVNPAWISLFPRVHQTSLPRLGFDHVPLRLEAGVFLPKVKRFRFEQVWFLENNLGELIQEWWLENAPEGCGAFILAKKLKRLKGKLREWAKETRSLTLEENQRQNELLTSLNTLLKQEEIYWRQRSRVKWVKEGDENTKFFHAFANGRRNRNYIPRLLVNNNLVEGSKELGRTFANHFRSYFGSNEGFRFLFSWNTL